MQARNYSLPEFFWSIWFKGFDSLCPVLSGLEKPAMLLRSAARPEGAEKGSARGAAFNLVVPSWCWVAMWRQPQVAQCVLVSSVANLKTPVIFYVNFRPCFKECV